MIDVQSTLKEKKTTSSHLALGILIIELSDFMSLYCKLILNSNNGLGLIFYRLNLVGQVSINTCCPIVMTGSTAESLCKLSVLHLQIEKQISTSHAFYIAQELVKLELSIILRQEYIQN